MSAALAVLFYVGLTFLGLVVLLHIYVVLCYIPHAVRIFQDKPLFIIRADHPIDYAETISFPTANGLKLSGCYVPAAGPRKGVIMFGVEFGSNCWSCMSYCDFLREQGYDIFAFECRGQGDSDRQPGYEPLQWVTDFEVEDFRAALAYLKGRSDADPRGVGFFGISKGAGAGLMAAANDPYVRCFVTDGAFASHTTMVPYMQKWVFIYCRSSIVIRWVPAWYFRRCAHMALARIEKERGCTFPHLEETIGRLSPRPLLMIHGGADTYIKPDMARALFERAASPKDFWLVRGAKHNHAFAVATAEYQKRVLTFFDERLAGKTEPAHAPAIGEPHRGRPVPAEPVTALSPVKQLLGILVGIGVGAVLGVWLVLLLIADI